jgi:hypothetical protein
MRARRVERFAMSKLELDAVEKMEFFARLEAILGTVKSLHASLRVVLADIAAIRSTVFDHDEELALYKSNLKAAVATAKPIVDDALRSYDDLMEEIAASQQWEN